MSVPERRPRLLAIVGPTASGKSALGIAVARRLGGEIVNCDSTAVYRGFDIGTDKVPAALQRGIPHHMVDVADPTESYSAARYMREASAAIRRITAAGRLPIVVGGSGLYYRALTRGLFEGPGRNPALRGVLGRLAGRRGVERLHRMLARVDPESAGRIHPRDEKRLVRALEVFVLTRRPLSEHFRETRPPLAEYDLLAFALRPDPAVTAERVARRVEQQFATGLLDEVRRLLAAGVPAGAHPFSGLVYRQVLEHMAGVRDEAATRELIVGENRRYARRQLIWFRKEPNLHWIDATGENPAAIDAVLAACGETPRRTETGGAPA